MKQKLKITGVPKAKKGGKVPKYPEGGPYPVNIDWDLIRKSADEANDPSLIDWDLLDKSVNASQLVTDVGQFTPLAPYAYAASLPLTAYSVGRDLYKGNYGDAAMDALGVIPGYRPAKMPITLAKDARRAAQIAEHAAKVKKATNYNRLLNTVQTGWDLFNVGRDQFGNYGNVPTSDNARVAPIPMRKKGGKVDPFYVKSAKDPRYQAYLDSMTVYNKSMDYANKLRASNTYEDWMDVVYNGYDKNSADANNRLLKYNKINYLEPASTYEKKLLNERGQETPISSVGIYAKPRQEVIIGRKKDTVAPLAGTKPSPLMTYTPQPVPLPTFYQPYLAPEGPATGPDEFLYDAGSGMPGYAFEKGGKVNPPIYVPVGDPRIQPYRDSLNLYNQGEDMWDIIRNSKTYKEATNKLHKYTNNYSEVVVDKEHPINPIAVKRESKTFRKPNKNIEGIWLQDRYAQPVQPYLPMQTAPTPIPTPVTQTTEWNDPMYAEPIYDQNGNLIGRRDIGNPGYAFNWGGKMPKYEDGGTKKKSKRNNVIVEEPMPTPEQIEVARQMAIMAAARKIARQEDFVPSEEEIEILRQKAIEAGVQRLREKNGNVTPQYQKGGEYDVDALELDRLRKLGYKVEIL